MKDESKDKLALATAIAGYASFAAAVIVRFLHPPSGLHRRGAAPSGPERDTSAAQRLLRAPAPDENLQSLSGSPHTALDALASRAAAEERGETRRQRISGSLAEAQSPSPPPIPQARILESNAVMDVLRHQSLDSAPLHGWKRPVGDRLPVPTFTPAVMAFGIVVFAMGLATVWYVCVAGSLVFAVAAWRWTGELQGE